MAEILLFHHIQGLTPGLVAFADRLREAGHTVHTPDLFEGHTFATISEGSSYANREGAPDYDALADEVAATLPHAIVYAGFSFGVMLAQRLAQQRPGATGALLFESFVDLKADWSFGPWPVGVPVQVHGKDGDPFFAGEGELTAAEEFALMSTDAELFVYPGDQHLFADPSLSSYDEAAAALLTERVLAFLSRV